MFFPYQWPWHWHHDVLFHMVFHMDHEWTTGLWSPHHDWAMTVDWASSQSMGASDTRLVPPRKYHLLSPKNGRARWPSGAPKIRKSLVYDPQFLSYVEFWLVVFPYPSEKWWSSSVGIMTFPRYEKNVPNHQPVFESGRIWVCKWVIDQRKW